MGAAVQVRPLHLIPVLALTVATVGIVVAPSAAADCNYSGGSTLCASGTVRGGSAPPQATFDPYPCNGDPTCMYYDNWDPNIYLDLGRPGGGGGGGPSVGGGPIIRPGGGGGRPGRG